MSPLPVTQETGTGEEHQGDAHVVNRLEMVVLRRVLRQAGNDARHVEVDEVVDGHFFLLMALVRIAADHGIALFARAFLYSIEHAGIIVGHQVGHHHSNHTRNLAPQTTGKGVRTVVQLLGQLLHTSCELRKALETVAMLTPNCSARSFSDILRGFISYFCGKDKKKI